MKKATSVTDREVELKNTILTAYDVKEKAIAYLKPPVLKHRGLFYFATRHHITNITIQSRVYTPPFHRGI